MRTKNQRKKEAENREEVRNNLSAGQQIKALDCRLGIGIGATKERTRLQKMVVVDEG